MRFARISLPPIEACQVNVTRDAWDEVEVWVTTSECRVWFRWRTSA